MLYLVRHGESTWNVEGRVQGQTLDVPLTRRGCRQASESAETLVRLGVTPGTRLFTSDQLRAVHTADAIAARLGLTPVVTADLRDQALGAMEGRLGSELTALPVPEGADISEIAWEGSETIEALWRRAARFISQHLSTEQDAVIVSHATFLQVLCAVLAGRSHRDVDWTLPFGNGAVVTWPPRALR